MPRSQPISAIVLYICLDGERVGLKFSPVKICGAGSRLTFCPVKILAGSSSRCGYANPFLREIPYSLCIGLGVRDHFFRTETGGLAKMRALGGKLASFAAHLDDPLEPCL